MSGMPVIRGQEILRIRIHNTVSGSVMISVDQGKTWRCLGTVIKPNTGNLHKIMDCVVYCC